MIYAPDYDLTAIRLTREALYRQRRGLHWAHCTICYDKSMNKLFFDIPHTVLQ